MTGFFIFLSALVISNTWRTLKMATLKQQTLISLIDSGQTVDREMLEEVFAPSNYNPRYGEKILAVISLLALGLSIISWEMGTLPVMIAALLGLCVVFYAMYSRSKKEGEKKAAASSQASPPEEKGE